MNCQVITTSGSSGHPFLFLRVFISVSWEIFLNSVGNIRVVHPLLLTPLMIEINLVVTTDKTKYYQNPLFWCTWKWNEFKERSNCLSSDALDVSMSLQCFG